MYRLKNKQISFKESLYIFYILIFGFIAYAGALEGLIQLYKGTPLWFFLMLGLLIILLASIKYENNMIQKNEWIIWIIIGIGIRVAYYCIVRTIQTSDFYLPTSFYQYLNEIGGYSDYTLAYKELDSYQIHYSLYPAWGMYMLIVHGIYKLFGIHTSLLVALNILLSGVTLLLYAGIMDECHINIKTKNIIIALLACFPQMVMWDAVAGPDHFTILFEGILVLVWCKSLNSKKTVLYILLEAMCVAMIGLFKPLGPFVIILLICAEVFIVLFRDSDTVGKCIVKISLTIVLSVGITGIVNDCNIALLEGYIKTDVQQATSFYLLWGYSVNENGDWSPNIVDDIITEAFESSETIADGIAYTNEVAKQTLKNNVSLIPRILIQKFKALFNSDSWSAFWSLRNKNNIFAKWLMENINVFGGVLTVLNAFSLFLMPFALIKKNEITIFLSLGWVGYICFLILASIQARYRYIVLPFQLVLAGLGYMELKGLLHEKW